MKNIFPSVFAGVALCATAAAQTFSVTDSTPGSIPDAGGTTWNSAPTSVLTRSVTVTHDVTGITAVSLHGLSHTWRGDLHVFLTNPAGTRFNVVVRPGFTGAGVGHGGDLAPIGTYTFMDPGNPAFDAPPGTQVLPPGTYNQHLNTGGGMWTSGTFPISNLALGSITGGKGTWSVTIVDWAAQDLGQISGWTLAGSDVSGPISFCEPEVGGVGTCPCGPNGGPGAGCDNFGAGPVGGATLTTSGNALATTGDTLVLSVSGENNTSLTIFIQGSSVFAPGSEVIFGGGLRCIDAPLLRLYTKGAVGGSASAPTGADPSVSTRSASLGDPIASSDTRYYMTFYRDPNAATPCGNAASTFNSSQAIEQTWGL